MPEPGLACCVCDEPLEGEPQYLGGRSYCARHYERVAREGPAAAPPILIEICVVVLFAAAVAGLAALTNPVLDGVALIAVGVLLALVPAAIWLVAFYRQDRLEPEPKRAVLGVFLLGGIMAEAIGQPLIRSLFHVQDWLYNSPLVGLFGSILVIGFVQEFLKYAGVRYTIFNSPEFDERVDGIIYGAAVGLGYATMLNLRYVLENRGVDLGVGVIQIAITALAHASFSGVSGYFLGRAKFERMGAWWLPLGLTAAAALNGFASFVLHRAPLLGGFSYSPWPGLVVAAAVAGATFLLLFAVTRRLNAATLAAASEPAAASA